MNSSYLIDYEDNTLKMRFSKTISAKGDRIVLDTKEQLDRLLELKCLPQGGLLKINGPASIPISYLIAHELGHLFSTIAIFDPKIGGEQQNRYVVAINYDPQYQVGDILEFEDDKVIRVSSCQTSQRDNSSFLLDLQDNILKVGFNPSITASSDRIVADVAARLDELVAEERITGDCLLKINGRASVIASYVIAHKLSHLCSAIAVFDPKIGDRGIDRYIVTSAHGSNKSIGDTLEYVVPQKHTAKVVICGSPNTGKTCFREGLKQALRNIPNIPDTFCLFISGCPDGDGAWFLETAQKYPDVARELKDKYKARFTPKFAEGKAAEISAIQNSLLVFDVGGKITLENWLIMSKATHAVILDKSKAGFAGWEKFCGGMDLPIIAKIYSEQYGSSDVINYENNQLVGSVHNLGRNESNLESRPMIRELAKLLVDLVVSSGD